MLQPSLSLAPDHAKNSNLSKKPICTKPRAIPNALPPVSQHGPLTELSILRPRTSDDGALLPDGGRGSPVKGSAFAIHYPPPPTFSSVNAQRAKKARLLPSLTRAEVTTDASRLDQIETTMVNTIDDHIASTNDDSDSAIDTGIKPAHSYAALIGMAIMRAPERKLTLSAIYAWISSTFSYYSASESGWQNSIRHNLSLNKAFRKVERPKDEPGKGHYWIIEPGCEAQFMKGKVPKRSSPVMAIDHNLSSKKDNKKRRVDFGDLQPTRKVLMETPKSGNSLHARYEPASPPLTQPRHKQALVQSPEDSAYHSPPDSGVFGDHSQYYDIYQDYSDTGDLKRDMSYAANALDLVLSPPQSSSPARQDRFFYPRTPAIPVKRVVAASPSTSLREHRLQMLQMLASPDTELLPLDNDDDPWLIKTPKPINKASALDSPWDEVAERAAFGSPDKRESRRRESRRSLVCGLHAQELYEVGFESAALPGVNVLDIMKRELERTKGALRRPGMMERSQSSLF